jgi:hypothetical protein
MHVKESNYHVHHIPSISTNARKLVGYLDKIIKLLLSLFPLVSNACLQAIINKNYA